MAKDGDPGVSGETAAPDASMRPPKAERKAAKQAAKAEAELARAAKRAAKAERAEARKAERKRARAEARAERARARAEAKAAKVARKAARAEQEVGAGTGPDSRPDERSAKKRKRKQGKRSVSRSPEGGRAARARALAARAGMAAAAAGSVLQEVAGLVRQAAEPAAARIVDRVVRPGDSSGGEQPTEPEATEPEPTEPEPTEPEPTEPAPEPRAPEPLAPEPAPAEPMQPRPEASLRESTAPESARESLQVDFRPSPAPASSPAPADVPWPSTDLPSGAPTPTVPAAAVPAAARPHGEAPAIVPAAGATVAAAVDIGANSAHLLVAAVSGHRLEPLLDESAFLGLGDRVTRDGFIGADARRELVETLAGYVGAARRLGASAISLVGTEPVRRAADAAMLVHEVEGRAGVPLHVVDHDEEAMLMLLGVTCGRSVTSELLVVDIGGGSSEFVIAAPGQPVRASGLRLGGAALTQEHAHSDPPTLAEIDAMRAAARAAMRDAPAVHPAEVIAVGGTASNLLKLLPATAVDGLLTRRRITVALAMLTVERSAEAAQRHLLRPQRARVLPAGALIVDAILEHYEVERLRVSDEGVREGAVLAAVVGGGAWRDRLPVLVAGWGEAELAAPV